VGYLQHQVDVEVHGTIGANFSYVGFNLQDPERQKPKILEYSNIDGP